MKLVYFKLKGIPAFITGKEVTDKLVYNYLNRNCTMVEPVFQNGELTSNLVKEPIVYKVVDVTVFND